MTDILRSGHKQHGRSKVREITVDGALYLWNVNDDMDLCIWSAGDKGNPLMSIGWQIKPEPVTPGIVADYIRRHNDGQVFSWEDDWPPTAPGFLEMYSDMKRHVIIEISVISIREHITAVNELIRRSFATVAAEFGLTQENCRTHPSFSPDEDLLRRLDREEVTCLGLFENDALVGFAALMPAGSGNEDALELTRLAIDPGCRHHGYGRRLVIESAEITRRRGKDAVEIGIINEDARLKAWYANLGFRELSTAVYPHLPFTVCYMTLDLKKEA